MEQTYKKRLRVNFSSSVKGIITADTTFEGIDMSTEEVIKEAAALFDSANKLAKERSTG